MAKKIKLLILNKAQFGYHTGTYYYCKYLANSFDITYVGWDYELPYLEIAGVNVLYISRKHNKIKRYINLIKACIDKCKMHNDVVIIQYFPLCLFIRLFSPKNTYVLDIRSGHIIKNPLVRLLANLSLIFETKFFKNISIISLSLAKQLGIDGNKIQVIPLGANIISSNKKSFDEQKLFYVGTFHHRNLEQTILGFSKYYKEIKNCAKLNYIIIGSGYNNEEKKFASLIKKEGLDDVITLLGPIHLDGLKPYFDTQNIGVSFIPKTPYFDSQPPTKTFEYLLSGMPVIATSTYENAQVVNEHNGILIEDNADSFCEGLKSLVANSKYYDSEHIRTTCERYLWKNIVLNDVKEYLIKLSN